MRNWIAPDRDILIIYEGQADNNFAAVFQKREGSVDMYYYFTITQYLLTMDLTLL